MVLWKGGDMHGSFFNKVRLKLFEKVGDFFFLQMAMYAFVIPWSVQGAQLDRSVERQVMRSEKYC